MRSGKSMITLLVFTTILVLGVGYSVVSNVNLSINGDIMSKTETLKVQFTQANPSVETNGVKGTVTGNLEANISVKDLELNQPKTVTFTIKNNETDLKAVVTEVSKNLDKNADFFQVTTNLGAGKTVEAGKTITVDVTVTLIKTPVTDAQSSATATIVLNAEPTNN